jgi:hypothetical protein
MDAPLDLVELDDVRDMSSLCRVVPLLAIQHPRVPSNTSLAEIRGRCRELLLMTVVTLTSMPPSHISLHALHW